MTLRAIAGLVVLNFFLFSVGAGVLWGLRGWRWWGELLRLAGVAYLLGVASFFIALTLELVIGIPIGLASVVLTGLALTSCGLLLGRLRGRQKPQLHGGRGFVPRLTLFGAFCLAVILVYLEGVFRQGRLAWLYEWDAWRVWTIRAKEIYFFGGLDSELNGVALIENFSYPPGVSGLQASAFEAMGSADAVTLHLQHWFLLIAFAGALAGLLAPRVRHAILLPFLLLVLLMPSLTTRATWALADLTLDYLVAVAALLLVLWLHDRRSWRLSTATLLMGGAMLTKREGILLVACAVMAALAASWGERRWAWPRLAASALVALTVLAPWRIWIAAHGLPSGGPEGGVLGLIDHPDRAWPSAKLVVRTLFDFDLWLLVPLLAVASVALALLAGSKQLAVFVIAFLAASVAASTWTIWANPTFGFSQGEGESPVVRLVGATVLVLAAVTPLVLERVWAGRESTRREAGSRAARGSARWPLRAVLPWAIVLTAVVAYPGSIALGYSGFRLPGGAPPFPSASDCVHAPIEGSKVRVVFGYEDSYVDALSLRDRAVRAGFRRTQVAQDGCGRLRVFVDDVPSIALGEKAVREAHSSDLDPTLERDPDA